MKKSLVVLVLAVLLSGAIAGGVSPCPIQNNIGSLISARITVAQQLSLVTLQPGTDTMCYNYSLPYPFFTVPEIAVAVHDFEARATSDLFFSIKPVQSDSVVAVPFLIRTHWKYTYWTKIAFSFIAEDRRQFQSGYYQIDSGSLGGCDSGKNIQVILPFKRVGSQQGYINHNLFLNGFQISSQKYTADALSPLELQIVQSSSNSSGITVLISVTTVTQVSAIHISYIAWVSTKLTVISGSYTYEPTLGSYDISHTPTTSVGRNYARINGLTGFIINNNYQNVSLSTNWTGTKFSFDFGISQKIIQYFSFQYIFFIGTECGSCPGYEYINNGLCLQECPAGSYPTSQKTCITCGDGYYWDGSNCIKSCPTGQTLNPYTNNCECPALTTWTGTICINCTSGKVYNPTTQICECASGYRWNGYSCIVAQNCINGKQWNVYTFQCECPAGTTWNGTYCVRTKVCTGGSYLNVLTNQCVCPDGSFIKNGVCFSTGCSGGQTWNGYNCACDSGYNWNGTYCLLCINGQIWNPISKQCLCDIGYLWNGNFCQKLANCSSGRVWNKDYQVCVCPDGYAWNGNTCIQKSSCCCGKTWNDTTLQCDCPTGFNWDGKNCVFCTNGKIWDTFNKVCVCQNGTQWNNQFCAVIQNCQGGTIWNQNTWACECPATTVWSGYYCLANPCTGGQIWDNSTKNCVCLGGKIYSNGYCVIPESTCKNGQVWDRDNYICKCPRGQWFNGVQCVPISSCINNQIYNPLTNQCVCAPGLVFLASKQICGDPTCPTNKRWDGQNCVDLACPPNSWYNGTECVCPDLSARCLPWQLFDGYNCVYYQDTCPQSTKWNGKSCATTSDCPDGFYKQNNQCKALPQQCIPPTVWSNGRCQSTNGACPYGTLTSGATCQPYTACSGNQTWNSTVLQCTCPQGTGWNGKECVVCGGGQIWNSYDGCTCPDGYFMSGSRCEKPSQNLCGLIPNSYYDTAKQQCKCNPGFSVVGYQCVCNGVAYDNYCDRCSYRPNSQFYYGICRCNTGYTLTNGQCLANTNNGNNTASDCSVGTFFDTQQKKCLSCPDGCLTCSDCYTCTVCSPDFIYDPTTSLCSELCGDGKRYTRECDDGNNVAGDGCSASCTIQDGYTCKGGSPASADSCVIYNPNKVSFSMLGQVRYNTRVVLNVKIDYLPKTLIQSTDCNDRCSAVLVANITDGEKPTSIKSSYVAGSRYTFSVEFQFSKPYMGKFKAEIKVSQSLSKYFGTVSIVNGFTVQVNPSQLTLAVRNNDSLV